MVLHFDKKEMTWDVSSDGLCIQIVVENIVVMKIFIGEVVELAEPKMVRAVIKECEQRNLNLWRKDNKNE